MRRFQAPSQMRPPRPTPSTTAATSTSTASLSTSSLPSTGSTSVSSQGWLFSVVHCRASGRKHKKWEDDGQLIVHRDSRLVVLKDADNREICRASGFPLADMDALKSGSGASISMGGRDVEVVDIIKLDTGDRNTMTTSTQRPKVNNEAVFNQFSMPKMTKPLSHNSNRSEKRPRKPVHDPDSPNALVMPTHSASGVPNENLVPVVVDPFLSRHLRCHQREGVVFLYECLMGLRDESNKGAILADDMGLGKTLQTISVIWTLLKQSPYAEEMSVIRKVLILSPSSLVNNWRKEFVKWLGSERIRVFAVDKDNKVGEYIKYAKKTSPVLIMSYEMFVRSIDEVGTVNFDLIVCDEGHRLKNDKIKASALLSSMSDVDRRIVLTGTPLQNDLKEFYALTCVVNPNVLGTPSTFAKHFESPIIRSKQPDASEDERELGKLRLEELMEVTQSFILRRSQDVIKNFLPPKTEYILFCKPTALQCHLYKQALEEVDADALFSLDNKCVLASIQDLRKICNHPVFYGLDRLQLPHELLNGTLEQMSGKLAVVSCFLHYIHSLRGERIVLVSISTQVLDILGSLCDHYNYKYLRLDGSTSASKRQSIVDDFNSKYCEASVLLLSSKAGGTGLNLIGAASILLYDMDWNPAHDVQAMARVWRDGQKKPVNVYRLATTGTVEEKILQRQLTKQSLGNQNSLLNVENDQFQFSIDELRDLFSFKELDSDCDTHLLVCNCNTDAASNIKTDIMDDSESMTVNAESDQILDNDGKDDSSSTNERTDLGNPNEDEDEKCHREEENGPENEKQSLGDKSTTKLNGLSDWDHLKVQCMRENNDFFDNAATFITFILRRIQSTLGQA